MNLLQHLEAELEQLKADGLYKDERVILSQQQAAINVNNQTVINLCANNYLGFANHPDLIKSGQKALDTYGYGLASVRFICGTQDIHKQLEQRLSSFLQQDDCILYSSCFDANAGLFETILTKEDAIISDSLNHASIIDGVRLCKAQRFRYANNDMDDLRKQLIAAKDARFRLIATDGVFSMDGSIADLASICQLADEFDALVMVDDSHAVGFIGEHGRGTPEHCGVSERIDILTGTLGKALGGASGGYTAARQSIVDWLRQRSRPYLFSNTLTPAIAAASITALDLVANAGEYRSRLVANSAYFRSAMEAAGFELRPGEHPIIPVMIGDAALAKDMADKLLAEGIYVIAFSYPVVPQGQARIRTQMSAALSTVHLDKAIAAFIKVGKQLKVIA